MSTPDSRTPQTAGQAAYEAHRVVVAVSLGLDLNGTDDFDGPPAAWELLAPSGRAAWEAAATAAIAAAAPAPTDLRPREGERGWHDVTCGACGEEFGTNFRIEEIECAECDARRCPRCATWFGGEEHAG